MLHFIGSGYGEAKIEEKKLDGIFVQTLKRRQIYAARYYVLSPIPDVNLDGAAL